MNPCKPHLWAMKWFMYSAQNEKARFEFDRAPMLAMRVQKSAPKHTMGQLRDIYAAAHAQQKLFATRRDNTRSMGATNAAIKGRMKRSATGFGPDDAPGTTPDSTRQEQHL